MKRADRQFDLLVVDDDPGDVLLIRTALERCGNTRSVHVAVDGQDAIAFLRRTGDHAEAPRPDLVLLDLKLPGMDGRRVLTEIKTDPDLRSIPVLVFSTSQDPDDIEASYALHANAYVIKPGTLEGFAAVLAGIDEFFTEVAALPTAS